MVTENLSTILQETPTALLDRVETLWIIARTAGILFIVYLIYLATTLYYTIKREKRIKDIQKRIIRIEQKINNKKRTTKK
jgi:hypothetical protein